jgi:uncharacterized protein (TIGR03085 family)
MSVTSNEQRELADLFVEKGPDAPTLCEGWTTRDLLVHMVMRERRPDAAAGIVIPLSLLTKHTERVTEQMSAEPYGDLVDTFRKGAPIWTPFGWPKVGDQMNLFEYYVHHEDVRRAGDEWEPRQDGGGRDDALWKSLKLAGWMFFRKSPVGVVLHPAGRDPVVAKKGEPSVTLVGEPGEIALIAFGRPVAKTRVVVEGAPEDIEAFSNAPRGL